MTQREQRSSFLETKACDFTVNAKCVFHPWETVIMPHVSCPKPVTGLSTFIAPSYLPYSPVLHLWGSIALTHECQNFLPYAHHWRTMLLFSFPKSQSHTFSQSSYPTSYPGFSLSGNNHQEGCPKTELNIFSSVETAVGSGRVSSTPSTASNLHVWIPTCLSNLFQ